MKKETSYSPHNHYHKNINKLIEISQMINKDNKYSSMEINQDFIKDLFHDLKNGKKLYDDEQWKPIKVAIINCFRLLQKGFIAEKQKELEGNIIILDKLVKEPNPKKMRLEKLSEDLLQDLFSGALNDIQKKSQQQVDIRKSFIDEPKEVVEEFENFVKGKEIPNEIIDKINIGSDKKYKEDYQKLLDEQRMFYEQKIEKLNNRMDFLEIELAKMKEMFKKIGFLMKDFQ